MGNNVKALAINKPVLQQHKGAAIFLGTSGIYDNDPKKLSE